MRLLARRVATIEGRAAVHEGAERCAPRSAAGSSCSSRCSASRRSRTSAWRRRRCPGSPDLGLRPNSRSASHSSPPRGISGLLLALMPSSGAPCRSPTRSEQGARATEGHGQPAAAAPARWSWHRSRCRRQLLVGAGLLTRSLAGLFPGRPATPARVAAAGRRVRLPAARFNGKKKQRRTFLHPGARAADGALPDVVDTAGAEAAASHCAGAGGRWAGRTGPPPVARGRARRAAPGRRARLLFQTLTTIPCLRSRTSGRPEPSDTPGIVIVDPGAGRQRSRRRGRHGRPARADLHSGPRPRSSASSPTSGSAGPTTCRGRRPTCACRPFPFEAASCRYGARAHDAAAIADLVRDVERKMDPTLALTRFDTMDAAGTDRVQALPRFRTGRYSVLLSFRYAGAAP